MGTLADATGTQQARLENLPANCSEEGHNCASAVEHTIGPWLCYADLPSTEPNWHIVTNASRMRVLANVHIEPGNATDEANARLITAAPDMFEALLEARVQVEILQARLGIKDYGHGTLSIIDAALAKAGHDSPSAGQVAKEG